MTKKRTGFDTFSLRTRTNDRGRGPKSRALSVEQLENRELLDAAGLETTSFLIGEPIAANAVSAAPTLASDAAIDLSSVESEDEVATKLDTPVVAPLGPVAVDYFQIVIGSVSNATTYRVFYSTSTQGLRAENCKYQDFSQSGLVSITGLQDNVTYYVQVQALDASGLYEPSDCCEHFRCKTATHMRAPVLLTSEVGAPTSVAVQLKAALKHADSYDFEIATDKDFVNVIETRTVVAESTGAKIGEVVFTDLLPNSTYFVHVRGVSNDPAYLPSDFGGKAGELFDFQTIDLAAPSIAVSACDFNGALLSCDLNVEPTSVLSLYLEYSKSADFSSSSHKTVSLSEPISDVALGALDSGETYYVRAKYVGQTSYGRYESNWSTIVSANTLAATPLDAPNLTIDSGTSIVATISEVANADAYVLEISANENYDGYTSVEYASAGVYEVLGLEYDVDYYFRVKAISETSLYEDSDYSAVASGVMTRPEIVQLDAPALTIADKTSSSVKFELGEVENAASYEVEVSVVSGFAISAKFSYDASGVYEIPNLASDRTYYFRAKAIGTDEYVLDSEFSAVVSAKTEKIVPNVDETQLSAPELTVVSATESALQIRIGEVENASEYLLEISANADFADASSMRYASAGAYEIAELNSASTYYLRVKALANAAGYLESVFASVVASTSAKQNADNPSEGPEGVAAQLGAPATSIVAKTASAVQVKIDEVDSATGYVLEFGTDPTFADAQTKTYSKATSVWLTGLTAGATYYFRAKATAQDCQDSEYAPAQVVTLGQQTSSSTVDKLGEPTLSIVAKTNSAAQIKIVEVEGATGYVLEYSTNPSFNDAQIKTYSGPKTTWLTDLATDSVYYFRVKAIAEDYLASDYSSVQLATLGQPETPSSMSKLGAPTLSILNKTNSAIQIKLDGVENATNYVLEYATNPSFTNSQTKTYAGSVMRWITGLPTDATYYVRAKASADGYFASDACSVQIVTLGKPDVDPVAVKLAVPTLQILNKTNNAVQLKLEGVENATGYVMEYATNPEFADAQSKTYAEPVTRWLTGLESGATYYFRLKSVAAGYVDSDWTEITSNRPEAATGLALQTLDAEDELDAFWDVLAEAIVK